MGTKHWENPILRVKRDMGGLNDFNGCDTITSNSNVGVVSCRYSGITYEISKKVRWINI